jgi:predicted RNA binding protein YcfA (HicA-like mRNA interferase family)
MKQIPKRKFQAFLRKCGLRQERTKGSHEVWNRPDAPLNRPVTIQTSSKDIPLLHIKTNLNTLGITLAQFLTDITDC